MSIQERLQMVMKMNNLTAAAFADKVGVQRSSISHVMSGRNKPSLDFIQKTLRSFPRVNGDWLVTGRNSIKSENTETPTHKENESDKQSVDILADKKDQLMQDEPPVAYGTHTKSKSIKRIVIFYSDGTFEETVPKTQ